MKRGDVVLMVARGDLCKPRPAIVVQSAELNDTATSVIVCPLTSSLSKNPKTRPTVEPDGANGLHLRSQIMVDKVISLEKNRVRQSIGTLDESICDELDRALLVVLGLAR